MSNRKSVASSTSKLIPAVGYLRKSTKGERIDRHGNKRQRQEKSIDQQRNAILKLAKAGRYQIVRWYCDEGVSGWKRGARRPDFYRMLEDAKRGDFKAVLTDDIDRFSRAKLSEVRADMLALVGSGV